MFKEKHKELDYTQIPEMLEFNWKHTTELDRLRKCYLK